MFRETRMVFEDEDLPSAEIELDIDHDNAVPELATSCERCGAPMDLHASTCKFCSASLFPQAPIPAVAPAPLSYAPPPPAFESQPVTRFDRIEDAIASIPYDFWKRVAFYPLLAIVLGNAFTCRGLSLPTNIALGVLIVLGVVGVIANVRQRSW